MSTMRERSATVCVISSERIAQEARPAPSTPVPPLSPLLSGSQAPTATLPPKVVVAPDFTAVVAASTSTSLAKPLFRNLVQQLPYSPVSLLPDQILALTFQWLDPKSLQTASCTCKRWNRVAKQTLEIVREEQQRNRKQESLLSSPAATTTTKSRLALAREYAELEIDKTALIVLLFILLYFSIG